MPSVDKWGQDMSDLRIAGPRDVGAEDRLVRRREVCGLKGGRAPGCDAVRCGEGSLQRGNAESEEPAGQSPQLQALVTPEGVLLASFPTQVPMTCA